MHLPSAILGSDIVTKLEERRDAAILTIGSDRFTRPQLSKIGCFNFTAAARLSHLLTSELKVKDTADLFKHYAPAHLAIPGLGAICLATVGAAFEIRRLGTLADYITRHQQKGQSLVTFVTLKRNELDAQAEKAERKALSHRRHSRLNRATKLRGDRHIARHGRSHLKLAKAS